MAYIDHFHRIVPLFGVCLGHQAMIEYFGGSLRVLPRPYHGKQSLIEHCGTGIYEGAALAVARWPLSLAHRRSYP